MLVGSSVQVQIKPSEVPTERAGGDLGFPLGSLGAFGFCFHSQCWSSVCLGSPF